MFASYTAAYRLVVTNLAYLDFRTSNSADVNQGRNRNWNQTVLRNEGKVLFAQGNNRGLLWV